MRQVLSFSVFVLFLTCCSVAFQQQNQRLPWVGARRLSLSGKDKMDIFDVTLTHVLPMPSEMMPADRFKLVVDQEGKTTVAYRGRESLRPLVDKVLLLLNGELEFYTTIRYIGNIGSGKSHNLAALTHYLRELKADPMHEFYHNVIYISSCELFFKRSPLRNLKTVVCEAFPNEREEINACKVWEDVVEYIQAKPKWSILFIFDDWNYVLSEKKLSEVAEVDRSACRKLLFDLSYGQYTIEAISSGSESLRTDSKAESEPVDTTFLYLFGGLTPKEWAAWKKSSKDSLFKDLSDADDKVVADFTGLVPLNLRTLEQMEKGGLSERLNKFSSTKLGQKTGSNLYASTIQFLFGASESEGKIFRRQMVNALAEVPAPLLNHRFYDHRYFYFDEVSIVLRPVSGFVRQLMRDILEKEQTK